MHEPVLPYLRNVAEQAQYLLCSRRTDTGSLPCAREPETDLLALRGRHQQSFGFVSLLAIRQISNVIERVNQNRVQTLVLQGWGLPKEERVDAQRDVLVQEWNCEARDLLRERNVE